MLLGSSFGWAISRDDSTRKVADWSQPGEYFNHWDIMSAMNVITTPGPQGAMGPALAAPERLRQGYIPEARISRIVPRTQPQRGGPREDPRPRPPVIRHIELAALDQPQTNAPLVIRVGDNDARYYTVEYRERQSWDAGFGSNLVLIHEVRNGIASVVTNYGGAERTVGETAYLPLVTGTVTLNVLAFNPATHTANLTLTWP